MTREERILWCIQKAEEIEADLPPQEDPHEWDSPRICAQVWRYLAERLSLPEAA